MLHVGNLTRYETFTWVMDWLTFVLSFSNVTAGHLEEIFGLYGKVKKVDLAKDRQIGLSKGYAYVEFEERSMAEQAQIYLDGGQLDGNILKVSFILVNRRRKSPDRRSASPRGRQRQRGPARDSNFNAQRDNRDNRDTRDNMRDNRGRRSPVRRRSPPGRSPARRRGSPVRRSPPRRGSPIRGRRGGDTRDNRDTRDNNTRGRSRSRSRSRSPPRRRRYSSASRSISRSRDRNRCVTHEATHHPHTSFSLLLK